MACHQDLNKVPTPKIYWTSSDLCSVSIIIPDRPSTWTFIQTLTEDTLRACLFFMLEHESYLEELDSCGLFDVFVIAPED
jgi:hypothetical protein